MSYTWDTDSKQNWEGKEERLKYYTEYLVIILQFYKIHTLNSIFSMNIKLTYTCPVTYPF